MSSTALFRPETQIANAGTAQAGPSSVSTTLGKVSLRVSGDFPALRGLWESMQAAVPCTAAQTYEWARAWTDHVLIPRQAKAVIVVGYSPDGTPLFLWPFEMGTASGFSVLKWLGQDHANYNMGLFAPDAASALTQPDMSALVQEAGRRTGTVAALLEAQPFAWDGIPNPFALLPRQGAPNSGYAIELGDFSALYRSQFSKRSRQTLDRKERHLHEMGSLTYGWAATHAERLALLETFFKQKARQFAAMGVPDIFDAPARAFYRDLALLPDDSPSRLRIGHVDLNGEVLATFSGTVCHGRIEVMLSSLTESDARRQSPGALLLRHQIKEACDEGLRFFDLGVGQARHKDEWSNTVYALFDSFIIFKPQGLLVTVPRAITARLKRAIKSNPHVWALAQDLRTRLKGRNA